MADTPLNNKPDYQDLADARKSGGASGPNRYPIASANRTS